MPKHKLLSVGASIMVLFTLVLAACGPSSGGTSTTGGPVKGGSLTDALFEEPDSLLPELTGETFSYLVDQAIWSPLLYSDDKGHAQPGLLKEVPSVANGDISADGMTYTLKLRSGLKWSDGTPLTSADVKTAADLFTASDAKGNSLYGSQDGWPNTEIASVTASDPTTTVVKLNTLDVTFLLVALVDSGTFTPLPTAVYGSFLSHPADVQNSDNNFWPKVTSGAFTITDRVKADHITLARNPNYYQGPDKPYLDKINFKIIPDQNTILTALQAGSVDATWFADINKVPQYNAISGYKVYGNVPSGYEAAHFNFKNPILADPVVRQAMSMSFDNQPLIHDIWHDLAKPTCNDLVGTFADDPTLIQSDGRCYTFDVAKANSLLDADGWKMGSDGFRTYQGTGTAIKQGTKLALRYSTTAKKTYREQTEVLAKEAWAKIGLDITIANYPAGTFFGKGILKNPDFTKWDIAEFKNGGAIDPDNHLSWDCDATIANAGANYGYYCNPAVDTLEKAQIKETDPAKRASDLKQVSKILIQDIPLMYYYASPDLAVATTKLHNYNPDAFGPQETWNVWDWYLSK